MKSEAAVQREVVRYLRALGYRVWRVGQRNARGTQDAGVSDLIVLGNGRCMFVEVKRADGRQSDAQKEFARAVFAVTDRPHYAVVRSRENVDAMLSAEYGPTASFSHAVVRSLADVDRVLGNHGQDHGEAD